MSQKPTIEIQQIDENHIKVKLNGEHFTTLNYNLFETANRLCLYPIITSSGIGATRNYPFEEIEGEKKDHIHHTGVWTAWGEVNKTDNWAFGNKKGRQIVQSAKIIQEENKIILDIEWTSPKGKLELKETRIITFHGQNNPRIIDFDIELTALQKKIKFGDTKEGGFLSLRVPTSMDVPRGGKIENARGGISNNQESEKNVWGKRAEWCDYSGEVEGKVIGSAILDHPNNINHPTYWHVRNYGLMTANPFGTSYFVDKKQKGTHTILKDETIRFRYRLIVHEGDAQQAQISRYFEEYLNN
jgi:methane monooxygenase PmoA-like